MQFINMINVFRPDAERESFFKFLTSIKVPYSTSQHCDDDATHIVANKLNR